MRNSLISILFIIGWAIASAQTIEKYELPKELTEISGLELLNDSLLVGLNDSGDKARLYVMNLRGEVIKEVKVKSAENVDWEDLARDDKYLYIADIGNNENKREGLVIYQVKINDVIFHDEVDTDEIKIEYKEQKKFPPKKDELFFDAEGITVYNDSIFLFTKNRSKPSSGTTLVYKIPTKKGKYKLKASDEIYIGKRGFWRDAITAADVYGDDFYLMTYNRIIIKSYVNGKFVDKEEIDFQRLTQKESIVVLNKNEFFIADEHQKVLGGRKLYHVKMNQ